MEEVWRGVAGYVVDRTLQGIMLECSYTNSQPADLLFGHLNPHYFMQEMEVLYTQVGGSVVVSVVDIVICNL